LKLQQWREQKQQLPRLRPHKGNYFSYDGKRTLTLFEYRALRDQEFYVDLCPISQDLYDPELGGERVDLGKPSACIYLARMVDHVSIRATGVIYIDAVYAIQLFATRHLLTRDIWRFREEENRIVCDDASVLTYQGNMKFCLVIMDNIFSVYPKVSKKKRMSLNYTPPGSIKVEVDNMD